MFKWYAEWLHAISYHVMFDIVDVHDMLIDVHSMLSVTYLHIMLHWLIPIVWN